MKKKWLYIILSIALVAVLFVPIPQSPLRDGGTRQYCALTYKIVSWNRYVDGGYYTQTDVYWLPDNFRSTDDLWAEKEWTLEHTFRATVVQKTGDTVLVAPLEGEDERRSSDRISFGSQNLPTLDIQTGNIIEITYTGGIMETYPARINATGWRILNDVAYADYTDVWIDPATAQNDGLFLSGHLVITEIYANCFFAAPVPPMPCEIKLNGSVADTWCVGDQVYCTYENGRFDESGTRFEADLKTIEPSDFEIEPGVAYKPVVYLYPEAATDVRVNLSLNGSLTCTYPKYCNGWQVRAHPDGTLLDGRGMRYNYLYWEGLIDARWDTTRGFCVKGEDTAAFLEQALEKLGLTRREANEMIVFWLPFMEQNPYNIIHFQTDAYENAAKLDVFPKPDTTIRVFMTFQSADQYVNIAPQPLSAPERTGFTLVEWGGTQLP